MKVKISFKHLEHTPSLDARITEKTQKLKKFFEGNVSVQWTCSVKDGQHISDVKLFGNNFEYFACAKADSLYKTIDMALDKIEKQLEKRKSKWKDHIHHKHGEVLKKMIQDDAA